MITDLRVAEKYLQKFKSNIEYQIHMPAKGNPFFLNVVHENVNFFVFGSSLCIIYVDNDMSNG
jgi:hypothetical protein